MGSIRTAAVCGLFRQVMIDGWQHEVPEDWLSLRQPLGIRAAGSVVPISFGGFVEYIGRDGDIARGIWHPSVTLQAVGWRGRSLRFASVSSNTAASGLRMKSNNVLRVQRRSKRSVRQNCCWLGLSR